MTIAPKTKALSVGAYLNVRSRKWMARKSHQISTDKLTAVLATWKKSKARMRKTKITRAISNARKCLSKVNSKTIAVKKAMDKSDADPNVLHKVSMKLYTTELDLDALLMPGGFSFHKAAVANKHAKEAFTLVSNTLGVDSETE
jgi:hypothetical protein